MQNDETDASSEILKKRLRRSEAQPARYWIQLVFSGKISSPVMLKDDAAVKAYVSENIEGIGYIDAGAVDDSIKIIPTIE